MIETNHLKLKRTSINRNFNSIVLKTQWNKNLQESKFEIPCELTTFDQWLERNNILPIDISTTELRDHQMQKFLNEQAALLDKRDEFRAWLRKKSIDPDDLTLEKFKQLSEAFDIEDRKQMKTEFNEWLKAMTGFETHQIRDHKYLDKQFDRFKQEVFAKHREEKEFEHYLQKTQHANSDGKHR